MNYALENSVVLLDSISIKDFPRLKSKTGASTVDTKFPMTLKCIKPFFRFSTVAKETLGWPQNN